MVMRHMFLGHFSLRNSLVRVLNVYPRQIRVEEHRSGQGQVIKGQLSFSIEYTRVIHVLYMSYSPVPVAQLVERWTPYGESTRPGYESPRVRGATGA